jgi:putative ABC transport system permease protein
MPLERSAGPLSIVLGLKAMVQNLRQTVMVAVILVTVSSAGVFGVIMYYNSSVDTKAFAEVPGFEISNVIAILNPASEGQTDTVKRIEKMKGVRKAQFYDQANVKVDDIVVPVFIMDDFAPKESRIVYEGRYPEAGGQIIVHGSLAAKLDKGVGDRVAVGFGIEQQSFEIVGFNSGINGANASMLKKDFEKLNPDFSQMSLMIHLEDGTSSAGFVKTMRASFAKGEIIEVVDGDKQLAEGMSSFQSIVSAMGVAILVITLCVIALVLYFVISASIVRRRHELGIYKAVGFSTAQLMLQFSVSFMAPVLLGTAVGAFLGMRYTNPLMSAAMKQSGALMPDFLVNPIWVISFCIGLVLVSAALSMLVTWRIRKISAYALVTE